MNYDRIQGVPHKILPEAVNVHSIINDHLTSEMGKKVSDLGSMLHRSHVFLDSVKMGHSAPFGKVASTAKSALDTVFKEIFSSKNKDSFDYKKLVDAVEVYLGDKAGVQFNRDLDDDISGNIEKSIRVAIADVLRVTREYQHNVWSEEDAKSYVMSELYSLLVQMDPRTSDVDSEKRAVIESDNGISALQTPLSKGSTFYVVGHKANKLLVSLGVPKFDRKLIEGLREEIENSKSFSTSKNISFKYREPSKTNLAGEITKVGEQINPKLKMITYQSNIKLPELPVYSKSEAELINMRINQLYTSVLGEGHTVYELGLVSNAANKDSSIESIFEIPVGTAINCKSTSSSKLNSGSTSVTVLLKFHSNSGEIHMSDYIKSVFSQLDKNLSADKSLRGRDKKHVSNDIILDGANNDQGLSSAPGKAPKSYKKEDMEFEDLEDSELFDSRKEVTPGKEFLTKTMRSLEKTDFISYLKGMQDNIRGSSSNRYLYFIFTMMGEHLKEFADLKKEKSNDRDLKTQVSDLIEKNKDELLSLIKKEHGDAHKAAQDPDATISKPAAEALDYITHKENISSFADLNPELASGVAILYECQQVGMGSTMEKAMDIVGASHSSASKEITSQIAKSLTRLYSNSSGVNELGDIRLLDYRTDEYKNHQELIKKHKGSPHLNITESTFTGKRYDSDALLIDICKMAIKSSEFKVALSQNKSVKDWYEATILNDGGEDLEYYKKSTLDRALSDSVASALESMLKDGIKSMHVPLADGNNLTTASLIKAVTGTENVKAFLRQVKTTVKDKPMLLSEAIESASNEYQASVDHLKSSYIRYQQETGDSNLYDRSGNFINPGKGSGWECLLVANLIKSFDGGKEGDVLNKFASEVFNTKEIISRLLSNLEESGANHSEKRVSDPTYALYRLMGSGKPTPDYTTHKSEELRNAVISVLLYGFRKVRDYVANHPEDLKAIKGFFKIKSDDVQDEFYVICSASAAGNSGGINGQIKGFISSLQNSIIDLATENKNTKDPIVRKDGSVDVGTFSRQYLSNKSSWVSNLNKKLSISSSIMGGYTDDSVLNTFTDLIGSQVTEELTSPKQMIGYILGKKVMLDVRGKWPIIEYILPKILLSIEPSARFSLYKYWELKNVGEDGLAPKQIESMGSLKGAAENSLSRITSLVSQSIMTAVTTIGSNLDKKGSSGSNLVRKGFKLDDATLEERFNIYKNAWLIYRHLINGPAGKKLSPSEALEFLRPRGPDASEGIAEILLGAKSLEETFTANGIRASDGVETYLPALMVYINEIRKYSYDFSRYLGENLITEFSDYKENYALSPELFEKLIIAPVRHFLSNDEGEKMIESRVENIMRFDHNKYKANDSEAQKEDTKHEAVLNVLGKKPIVNLMGAYQQVKGRTISPKHKSVDLPTVANANLVLQAGSLIQYLALVGVSSLGLINHAYKASSRGAIRSSSPHLSSEHHKYVKKYIELFTSPEFVRDTNPIRKRIEHALEETKKGFGVHNGEVTVQNIYLFMRDTVVGNKDMPLAFETFHHGSDEVSLKEYNPLYHLTELNSDIKELVKDLNLKIGSAKGISLFKFSTFFSIVLREHPEYVENSEEIAKRIEDNVLLSTYKKDVQDYVNALLRYEEEQYQENPKADSISKECWDKLKVEAGKAARSAAGLIVSLESVCQFIKDLYRLSVDASAMDKFEGLLDKTEKLADTSEERDRTAEERKELDAYQTSESTLKWAQAASRVKSSFVAYVEDYRDAGGNRITPESLRSTDIAVLVNKAPSNLLTEALTVASTKSLSREGSPFPNGLNIIKEYMEQPLDKQVWVSEIANKALNLVNNAAKVATRDTNVYGYKDKKEKVEEDDFGADAKKKEQDSKILSQKQQQPNR